MTNYRRLRAAAPRRLLHGVKARGAKRVLALPCERYGVDCGPPGGTGKPSLLPLLKPGPVLRSRAENARGLRARLQGCAGYGLQGCRRAGRRGARHPACASSRTCERAGTGGPPASRSILPPASWHYVLGLSPGSVLELGRQCRWRPASGGRLVTQGGDRLRIHLETARGLEPRLSSPSPAPPLPGVQAMTD